MKVLLLSATMLCVVASAHARTPPTAEAVCADVPSVGTLLPCGPLHTKGSQTVDQQDRPVRLNCAAWWGDMPNWDAQMLTLVTSGFNCLRISTFNASLDHDISMIDRTIEFAKKVSVRIIVNNHANEGGGDCASQQVNGLWFDRGPGSDGTDGCGTSGQVDDAKWISDWVKVATRYKGNQTIVGYDLWNEPLEVPGKAQWGGGGTHDLRAAYIRAGNAIQAVDSDKLIITEGPIAWAPLYQADLSGVRANPVTLVVPNKVVYSVHLYPSEIGGQPNDSGPAYVQQMNTAWGYLITENISPVWIGELGASMTTQDGRQWAATVVPYLNGKTPGGIVIPVGGQGVGTDWWMWSTCVPDPKSCAPDGALEADKSTPKQAQSAVYSLLVQKAAAGVIASGGAFAAQTAILSATAFPNAAATADKVNADIQAAMLPLQPATASDAVKTAQAGSPVSLVTGDELMRDALRTARNRPQDAIDDELAEQAHQAVKAALGEGQ